MTKVSSFFSNVFMFVGGTLVIVLALWSFMSPKYPSFSTINLDFNLDQEGSTNFYDEQNLSYTIEKPIQNWNDKRRQWFNLHPSFKLEGEKERILIVSGSQSTPCKNPVGDHLLLRFFKNKVDYSRIHGYDIFYNDVLLEPKMFFFWAKLPAVRAAMVAHPEAEWIWWVDSDAAFTDMDFKLPLKKYKNHNFVVYGWPKLIYENKSWTGINAGVFLIRNCQWSMDLIEAWAKMGPQSPEYNKWGEILRTTFKDKNFPQSDDQSDFYLSDAQQEHALAVEQLAPRLPALRIELCPIYMNEARFWEIYFVLLHPRLDKQDAKLLSTPQVVKARTSLAQELHKRTKPIEEDWPEKRTSESNDRNNSRHEEIVSVPSTALSADVVHEMSSVESSTFTAVPIPATKKQPVLSSESQVVDKPVVEGGLITHSNVEKQPVISREIQIVDKPVVEGGLITHSNVEKQPVISSEIQIVDKPVVEGGHITHSNVEKQSVISSEIQIIDKPVVEGGVATHKNVEKQPAISSEIQIVDKSVVEGGLATHKNVEKPQSVSTSKLQESDEDDGDDWLKEKGTEFVGVSKTTIPIDNEEDVSFSDLEEDDMDVPANV